MLAKRQYQMLLLSFSWSIFIARRVHSVSTSKCWLKTIVSSPEVGNWTTKICLPLHRARQHASFLSISHNTVSPRVLLLIWINRDNSTFVGWNPKTIEDVSVASFSLLAWVKAILKINIVIVILRPLVKFSHKSNSTCDKYCSINCHDQYSNFMCAILRTDILSCSFLPSSQDELPMEFSINQPLREAPSIDAHSAVRVGEVQSTQSQNPTGFFHPRLTRSSSSSRKLLRKRASRMLLVVAANPVVEM